MKKIGIALGITSLLVLQAPAQSISAKLNSYQPKPLDNAGKVIVASVCDDFFPAAQELMAQSKSDLKDLVKLQLQYMALDKEQLHTIKLMAHDAAPLMLEGAHLCASLIKKHSRIHGKSAIAMYKKIADQMVAEEGNGEVLIDRAVYEHAFGTTFDSLVDDAQLNQWMEKIQSFNDKWAESFAAIMQASDASTVDKEMMLGNVQQSVQKIFATAFANKRAVRMQSSLIPIVATVKTRADIVRVINACLDELETKLPQVVVSSEQFVVFAAPFLTGVITESVDEMIKSMPA